MELLDWIVLSLTILGIVSYGLWKSKGKQDMDNYLKGGKTLPWYTISLSIIATQASAITFLSAPGQAYIDGMRFVLFYLGLPIAMIVVSAFFLPVYYRLNVYTAYEFLESRFDVRTRMLTSFFFLIQRGLAAGISIAAPAIVLAVILEWNIFWINLFIGFVVILYTVTGGSKAVSQTQKLQMIIILSGMGIAGYLVVAMMPESVGFQDAMRFAGKTGKLNTMDFAFDLDNKYNFWSGLIGGFFLQMAYFGTDQSQVGRYLGGSSMSQSRLGLLFNGIFKIPMQFAILLIGAMLFVFYQFQPAPLFFNTSEVYKIENSRYAEDYAKLEAEHQRLNLEKRQKAEQLIVAMRKDNPEAVSRAQTEFEQAQAETKTLRREAVTLLKKNDPNANDNDANYIFLTFVTNFLPVGLVGLLIAVILSASMSTTASELNALASTSVVDLYKRGIYSKGSDGHYVIVSKLMTVFWGLLAIVVAQLANHLGTLIEVVNMLGSLFYGTILGIFLLALFFKKINANAAFWAAIIGEIVVIGVSFTGIVAYLWLNLIGCFVVVALGLLFNQLMPPPIAKSSE